MSYPTATTATIETIRSFVAKFTTVNELEYQSVRKAAASELGVSQAYLDREYARERKKRGAEFHANGKADVALDSYFRPLGYDRERHFFYNLRSRQMLCGAVSKPLLLQLAPIEAWENIARTKRGVDWDSCSSLVIAQSYQQGIFLPDRVRARGVWSDNGRVVVHTGHELVVNGGEVPVDQFESNYLYELSKRIDIDLSRPPLSANEAREVLRIGSEFCWASPLSGVLLAGWVVIAPLCGRLRWRSHVWITGPAGAGKTELVERYVKPLLPFRFDVSFGAGSTEAGIRQTLCADSLPMLYDEAEADSDEGRARMRRVLLMLRGATSSAADKAVKGTTSGRALDYKMQSCVLLSSVNVPVEQDADVTRITPLELMRGNPQQWAELEPRLSLFTREFGERLFSRTINLVRTLEANIATFQSAVAQHLNDSRAGQQFGTLLAGAYLLDHNDEISLLDAWENIRSLNWEGLIRAGGVDLDECRCLTSILGVHVSVNVDGEVVRRDEGNSYSRSVRDTRTLGELVRCALGEVDPGVHQADARSILARYGIRIDPGDRGTMLCIANRNDELSRKLSNHAWDENGWRQYLARLPGAERAGAKVKRFAGVVSSYVELPITSIETSTMGGEC